MVYLRLDPVLVMVKIPADSLQAPAESAQTCHSTDTHFKAATRERRKPAGTILPLVANRQSAEKLMSCGKCLFRDTGRMVLF